VVSLGFRVVYMQIPGHVCSDPRYLAVLSVHTVKMDPEVVWVFPGFEMQQECGGKCSSRTLFFVFFLLLSVIRGRNITKNGEKQGKRITEGGGGLSSWRTYPRISVVGHDGSGPRNQGHRNASKAGDTACTFLSVER